MVSLLDLAGTPLPATVILLRKHVRFVLVTVGLLIAQQPAVASLVDCPAEDVATLVGRTRNIVLADVVSLSIQDETVEYRIKVKETIKGSAPPTSTLRFPVGTPGSPAERTKRFSIPHRPQDARALHRSTGFWLNEESSGMLDQALCSGVFELRRGRYLMLLDEPYNVKAFEPVPDLDDPWYKTVKAIVSDPRVKGRAIDPISFLRMFDSGYLAQCFRPGMKGRKPRLLFGRELSREFDPAVWSWGDTCREPRMNHLVLFRGQSKPIFVEFDGDALHFAEKYGDLFVVERKARLEDVLLSLRDSPAD